MKKFNVLTFLGVIFFTITLTDGAQELQEFNLPYLLKDVNLTELSDAIYANHPHSYLDAVQIVKLYGYNVEIHYAKTSDGYILEVHRITGNKKNPNPKGKPVVLLQHGILASSSDWVLAGPERGLAFLLADAGYDVWMGNVRGSRYSRTHKDYDIADSKYWNFSWHEIGTRDLPAIIDYILRITERKKVYYIGHSQGSTAFFVMMSELPEYNDKIIAMFSLAPVAYCSKMFSPIFQVLARFSTTISVLSRLIGVNEFKPSDEFFKKFTNTHCQEHTITQPLCMNIVFMLAGYSKDQLDMKLLPAILAHIPAGSSVKQFIHYSQIIRSGHFRQFDHGLSGNVAKYHQLSPPSYNLKNIKVPVALHYSVNDWLSDKTDIENLRSKLPNPIGKFRIPHDKFNHLDYLYGKDVKILLYNKIMSLMLRYKD